MQARAQGVGLGAQLFFAAPGADHFLHFRAVGGDDGGVLVARVVAALGVNQYGFASRAGLGNHVAHLGQAAFAVVRKNDGVLRLQKRRKARGLVGQHAVFGSVLKIQAQELLLAANDAQLDRGLEFCIAAKVGLDAGFGQQRFQVLAGLVVAHHGQQRRLRAQGGNIARHIGCAAAAFFFAGYAHHGHGRLGGYAVYRAVPVAVQHHVAHHQHAGGGELCGGDGGRGVWGHRCNQGKGGCGQSSSTRRGG